MELILLRHGESEWNARNLFTGWVDVSLSDKGISEARRGGVLLRERNLLPDVVHTSLLRRAIHTANLALAECERDWVPVQVLRIVGVIDLLEDALDQMAKVARTIRTIELKES